MRRISHVTLALIVAAAAAGAAPPAAAASADSAADRPLLSRLFERLLGPFLALGGGEQQPNAVPPRAAPAEGEQDGGPENDPDGLTAAGGSERDPSGLDGSGGTPPLPSSPAKGE
jgi:hypothetical protein